VFLMDFVQGRIFMHGVVNPIRINFTNHISTDQLQDALDVRILGILKKGMDNSNKRARG
jgi:putative N-acetylmannosamine-6-phosphate epimerase